MLKEEIDSAELPPGFRLGSVNTESFAEIPANLGDVAADRLLTVRGKLGLQSATEEIEARLQSDLHVEENQEGFAPLMQLLHQLPRTGHGGVAVDHEADQSLSGNMIRATFESRCSSCSELYPLATSGSNAWRIDQADAVRIVSTVVASKVLTSITDGPLIAAGESGYQGALSRLGAANGRHAEATANSNSISSALS